MKEDCCFAYDDGTEVAKSDIQTIIDMELRIDGEVISIPNDGLPYRSKANAIITQMEMKYGGLAKAQVLILPHGPCVRVSIDVPSGTHETVDFAVTLHSATHTWWHSTRMDGKIDGKSEV